MSDDRTFTLDPEQPATTWTNSAGRAVVPTTTRQPGRRGQPPKFPTHSQTLLAAIRKGYRPATARKRVGVGASTVRKWLQLGSDAGLLAERGVELTPDEQAYLAFLGEYQHACIDMQARLEKRLSDLVPQMDAKEILATLERIDREVWGRHDRVTMTTTRGDDEAVLQRWAETIGFVIRGVLSDCHLTDEQLVMAEESLAKRLGEVTIDGMAQPEEVEL